MALFDFLRCRNFFGCLPLQSGIWILALVGVIVAGFGAAGSVMELMLLKEHPVPVLYKLALFVQTIIMGILGIVSFFGIMVAFMKSHGAAFIYSKIVLLHFLLSIPVTGYMVFAVLHSENQTEVTACVNGAADDMIRQFCESGFSVVKGFGVALVAVIILIQFYAFVIARSWVEALDHDNASKFDRELDFDSKHASDDFTRTYANIPPPRHPSPTRMMPRFQDPNGKMYY